MNEYYLQLVSNTNIWLNESVAMVQHHTIVVLVLTKPKGDLHRFVLDKYLTELKKDVCSSSVFLLNNVTCLICTFPRYNIQLI